MKSNDKILFYLFVIIDKENYCNKNIPYIKENF